MLAPKHLTTERGRLHQQRFDAGDFILLHGEKKYFLMGWWRCLHFTTPLHWHGFVLRLFT